MPVKLPQQCLLLLYNSFLLKTELWRKNYYANDLNRLHVSLQLKKGMQTHTGTLGLKHPHDTLSKSIRLPFLQFQFTEEVTTEY